MDFVSLTGAFWSVQTGDPAAVPAGQERRHAGHALRRQRIGAGTQLRATQGKLLELREN